MQTAITWMNSLGNPSYSIIIFIFKYFLLSYIISPWNFKNLIYNVMWLFIWASFGDIDTVAYRNFYMHIIY